MRLLFDTNIVSEVRKRHANQQVLTWFRSVPSRDLYVSVLLLGEIRAGIERLRARGAERAAAHEAWRVRLVESYRGGSLPVSAEISDCRGRLSASRPRPAVDRLIGRHGPGHGPTLVTRNVADAAGTGVEVLDPFQG